MLKVIIGGAQQPEHDVPTLVKRVAHAQRVRNRCTDPAARRRLTQHIADIIDRENRRLA